MTTTSSNTVNDCDNTADNPIKVDPTGETEEDTIRKRKKTSKVWDEFTTYKNATGKKKAQCIHCKKSFVGDSNQGTSHLANHLKRFIAKIYKNKGQKSIFVTEMSDSSTKIEAFKFDQYKSRMDLATMIVKHNYLFSLVEHEFFEYFCNGLNSEFKIITRNTVRADIIKLHNETKVKVNKMFDGLDYKFMLITDIWTSDSQNFAYACLTAYYIDDEWELHKKILNYRIIVWPYDAEGLFRFISQLIMEWNLDKKLFSMVVDNASANDSMVRHLKVWLLDRLPCIGALFHVRCSAHILNLIGQDGSGLIKPLLNNIRGTMRYLSKSSYGKQKFDLVVSQLKLQGKKRVPMDVPHRWNSTFEMLDVALIYKEAFNRQQFMDTNYKLNYSKEKWKLARFVRDCLRIFNDASIHFSGTRYPTANVFFPDICEIKLQLHAWENSPEECLRMMACPVNLKFSKYWDECSLYLAIVVILDPRFKMDIIEYYYDKLYSKELCYTHVKRVRTTFFALYIEYGGKVITSESIIADLGYEELMSSSRAVDSTLSQSIKLSDFKRWRMKERYTGNRYVPKSEFDQYMEEEIHLTSGKFGILTWWSVNGNRFPTISKIARDVLAVPAITVAFESAFSIGGRVIDETRASLLPEAVEALITAADWILSRRKTKENEQV